MQREETSKKPKPRDKVFGIRETGIIYFFLANFLFSC